MIFINTRPTERANNLTAFLQAQHIDVLDMPLLELVACDLTALERHYLKNLAQVNFYQAIIFISETTVRYFFEYIDQQQIQLNPNLTVIAVGQKTAQTFKKFWQKDRGAPPNIITPSEFDLPENNGGLLQLPLIHRLKQGDNLLILKGKAGRALLKNTLIEKGVMVHEVDFYQRVFPSRSMAVFQEFFLAYPKAEKIVVLITSLTAWYHWQQILLSFPNLNLDDFYYVVLQDRIADRVKNFGKNLRVIYDLSPTTIAHSLQTLP